MSKLPVYYFSDYMLRPMKEDDLLDYYLIGNDEENVKFLSWDAFKSLEEAEKQLHELFFSKEAKKELGAYAIVNTLNNQMIGMIDYHTRNKKEKSTHIGYLLHRDYWNLGIITEALEKIVEIGFKYLKLKKIYVKAMKENYGSRRVCEKNNFTLVEIKQNGYFHDKTNRYYDIYTYVIERKRYNDSKTKRNL